MVQLVAKQQCSPSLAEASQSMLLIQASCTMAS